MAFGLAVDDTIHFITRYRQERDERRDVPEAVTATIRHVGPVLMITTVVLVCGIGVTLFGQMPQTRTFGTILITTLFSALIADLLFTPALILAARKIRWIGRLL